MTPAQAVDTLTTSFSWLPPDQLARVVARIVVFLSSGPARKFGEYEYQTWAQFMHDTQLGDGARRIFVDYATRFAAQSHYGQTSARCFGQAFESEIYPAVTGRGSNRVFDAPTNEAWIDPWINHLQRLGVKLRLGHQVTALSLKHGEIAAAAVRSTRGTSKIDADWYVVALPVDWATKLWSRQILHADPQLARSFRITGGWMTGLQLYLRRPTPIAAGVVGLLDSPWAISGVSQAQFWKRNFSATYGDGTIADKFSAIIVDWDTPGNIYGKPARDCTRSEIDKEVWAQFKAHMSYLGGPKITDDLLAGTFLDPGIRWRGNRIIGYDDPLPRSDAGTWDDKPVVASSIPNMFLASDYVKVQLDVSSMEGANEAARHAVNALLDRAGSLAPRAQVFDRWLPEEWAALRELDDQRYAAGQPNLFDTNLSVDQINSLLSEVGESVGGLLR
jgi:uncharacterized protein with NAD-binding domain and iron-sulfur cluster